MTRFRIRLTYPLLFAATLLTTVFGANAAGPQAYVGNFKDNTVSVIDTGSGTVVATLPVASGPHGMTQTPDGRTVYISGDASSDISVIDTASNRVTRTIDVGKSPHGLAMMPDGRMLLVGVYGDDRVAFVDTASNTVIASVTVAKPHTIAVRPDGKVAYVASQEPGKFALAVIDLAARTVLRYGRVGQATARPRIQRRRTGALLHPRRYQRSSGDRSDNGQDRCANSNWRITPYRFAVP